MWSVSSGTVFPQGNEYPTNWVYNQCCQLDSVMHFYCLYLCFYIFFSSETDESCKKHLGRVLSIWEERSVYENDVLEQLKQALCKYIIIIAIRILLNIFFQ